MTIINRDTFEPSSVQTDLSGSYSIYTHFQVDEILSEIISILNIKGYRTLYSCAGHYYPEVYVEYKNINEIYDIPDSDWFRKHHFFIKDEDTESEILYESTINPNILKITSHGFANNEIYILFEGNSILSTTLHLPKGFKFETFDNEDYDGKVKHNIDLTYKYKNNLNFIDFMEEQLNACKNLTEWVKELPYLNL